RGSLSGGYSVSQNGGPERASIHRPRPQPSHRDIALGGIRDYQWGVRKRTALLGLCAVLAIAPACQDDAPPAPPAAPQPVPAPPGLLAELVIARPDRALGQVREAAGGPMLLLPRTVGGVLVNVL